MKQHTIPNSEAIDLIGRLADPKLLKNNLIVASMFVAVFEVFKAWIIDNVHYFYFSGFENGKESFDGYDEQVLCRVGTGSQKQIRGTLAWLQDHGAITEHELASFRVYTDIRNRLGHELFSILASESMLDDIYNTYYNMVKLFEKIVNWWFQEVETPIAGIELDNTTTTNLILEFIKMMTDVAFTGNREYLEELQRLKV